MPVTIFRNKGSAIWLGIRQISFCFPVAAVTFLTMRLKSDLGITPLPHFTDMLLEATNVEARMSSEHTCARTWAKRIVLIDF